MPSEKPVLEATRSMIQSIARQNRAGARTQPCPTPEVVRKLGRESGTPEEPIEAVRLQKPEAWGRELRAGWGCCNLPESPPHQIGLRTLEERCMLSLWNPADPRTHVRFLAYLSQSIVCKGVASMRQDEANASSCFRGRQIFAHLFHDKANVNFNQYSSSNSKYN